MAQAGKDAAAKPDHPILIPRTQMVEEQIPIPCPLPHTLHTKKNKQNKFKSGFLTPEQQLDSQ